MEGIIELAVGLGFLLFCFAIGSHREKKHYKSIRERESGLTDFPIYTQSVPLKGDVQCILVAESVVISIDYFKHFLGRIINVFGGRITAYETVLDRGRREAILRVKEKAKELGAAGLLELRVETSNIATSKKKQMGASEVLAYATAVIPQ